MSLTIAQQKNADGFPKAGELIEFRTQCELSLQDRRIMNLLIEHAWPQIMTNNEHRIAIATLRLSHKGGERVRNSVTRLMSTIIEIPTTDAHGKKVTRRGQLLADTTTTDNENDPSGEVRYKFSQTIQEIMQQSQYWGRLKICIICAFQSKYALTLYEALCLRKNLQISEQEINTSDFRSLLGVTHNKLQSFKNLKTWAIDPAVKEINTISDFWIEIQLLRQGGLMRGKLIGFRLIWSKKTEIEWNNCFNKLLYTKNINNSTKHTPHSIAIKIDTSKLTNKNQKHYQLPITNLLTHTKIEQHS